MTEKELAAHIANSGIAKRIVDEMGGITIGGATLCDEYMKAMYKSCPNYLTEIERNAMALRHWIAAAGYNKAGDFEVIVSTYIQNC